ncbi:F-box domain-containing protein [Mycena indigotica]|uniref:F-box domain-containing protein n=1 Tax=Mycena indigotica TaxID=2126181 RepID=A0A8H6W9R1_9AGAR|nr:F-box domain-containing protein [Mycena indigotica]KAF7306873.1 F-box domain-containing protein [Mycena indigotica]
MTVTHTPLFRCDGLRFLAFNGCIACIPPLKDLATLHLYHLHAKYPEFRMLIQGLPNLKALILQEIMDDFDDDPEKSNPPFEATSIRSLSVSFVNDYLVSSHEKPLLCSLLLPNLEYLEITGDRRDYGEFSGKDYPHLKTLHLREINFESIDCTIYQSFRKITRLEMHHVTGVGILFEGTPWPLLETVVYEPPPEKAKISPLLVYRPNVQLILPERYQNAENQVAHDPLRGLLNPELFARGKWDDLDDTQFSDELLEDYYGGDSDYEDNFEYEVDYNEEEDEYEEEDDDWDYNF